MFFGNYDVGIGGSPITFWEEDSKGMPIPNASKASLISIADIGKPLGKLKLRYSSDLRVLPEKVLQTNPSFSILYDLVPQIGQGRDVVEIPRRERGSPLMLYPADLNGNPVMNNSDEVSIVWFGRPGFQRMGELMVNYLGPLVPVPYEQTFGTELHVDLKKALNQNQRELGLFVPSVFVGGRRAA